LVRGLRLPPIRGNVVEAKPPSSSNVCQVSSKRVHFEQIWKFSVSVMRWLHNSRGLLRILNLRKVDRFHIMLVSSGLNKRTGILRSLSVVPRVVFKL